MSALEELRRRRERLVARARRERADLALGLQPFAGAIRLADRGLAGARLLRYGLSAHPLLSAAAAGLVLVLRPRGFLRALRLGIGAWQAWRLVAGALRAR